MGVAHHSAYVVWIEAARVEWLREHGLRYRQLEDEGISLAVSGLRVSYRASTRFDDEVEIITSLLELRSRRIRLGYLLTRTNDGTPIARAETVHVPTNRHGRAIRLPDAWLDALTPWLEPTGNS